MSSRQNPFDRNNTGYVRTAAFVVGFNAPALAEFVTTVDLLNGTPRAGNGANVVKVVTAYSEPSWPLSGAESVVKVRATEALLWDLANAYPVVAGW